VKQKRKRSEAKQRRKRSEAEKKEVKRSRIGREAK
jgi:hypothetical protein